MFRTLTPRLVVSDFEEEGNVIYQVRKITYFNLFCILYFIISSIMWERLHISHFLHINFFSEHCTTATSDAAQHEPEMVPTHTVSHGEELNICHMLATLTTMVVCYVRI